MGAAIPTSAIRSCDCFVFFLQEFMLPTHHVVFQCAPWRARTSLQMVVFERPADAPDFDGVNALQIM